MRRSEAQLRVGPGAQSRGGHQRLSFSHAARRGIAEPHLSRFFRCPHPPINKVLTSLSSVEGRAIETSASQSLGCALTLQSLLLLFLSLPRRSLEHPSLVHPDAPRSICYLLACDR